MHAQSHYQLGQHLTQLYLKQSPRRHRTAFMLGCLEPDRNPITYLKGSIRCHWLRGHHWLNAQRYMQRISQRLERRTQLNSLDFYTLGKLIHYTADAFTYAHNEFFRQGLSEHRNYERLLNQQFLTYIKEESLVTFSINRPIMDAIRTHHGSYSNQPGSIRLDCIYSTGVCCGIMEQLICQPTLCK